MQLQLICNAIFNDTINKTLKSIGHIIYALGPDKLRSAGNSCKNRLQYALPSAFAAQG